MSGRPPFDGYGPAQLRSATMCVEQAVAGRCRDRWTAVGGLVAFVLCLLLVVPAFAQNQPAGGGGGGGEVIQIGFGGYYEPTSWIPMKVRLRAPDGESGAYVLRTHVRDLDGDRAIYERTVALTAGAGGQEFWTYFKAEPTAGNIEPGDELRVVLADTEGREVAQLAVALQQPPLTIDTGSGRDPPRRLVLLVSEPAGGRYLGAGELAPGNLLGLTEVTVPAALMPRDLPDRAIGYDGVSAVVWQDADPSVLLEGGGERLEALRQYVRDGGRLIVTHRADWQSLQPIFDLLPVSPAGDIERTDLRPLRDLALANARNLRPIDVQPFAEADGPFRFVAAAPKPEAIVERWMTPEDLEGAELPDGIAPDGRLPLVARAPYGYGSVTWVAIDLGNPTLVAGSMQRARGWTGIWTSLLDVGEEPLYEGDERQKESFSTVAQRDFGAGLLNGTRLAGKSVALVTLALIFFIAYWLLAGPGLYFYLATKRKTQLSWFAFGAAAAIATVLTIGLTRLVLGGDAELRHVSLERAGNDTQRLVRADLGLYIPRDGVQRISLDGAVGPTPSLTNFVPPSDPLARTSRSNPISYVVPLDAPADTNGLEGEATVVEMPYRSTLKKLEADWHGPATTVIDGTPRLTGRGQFPEGSLINASGRDLRNVHIAYKVLRGGRYEVLLLYLPTWNNGVRIESLKDVFNPEGGSVARLVSNSSGARAGPPRDAPVYGLLGTDWADNYWYRQRGIRTSLGEISAGVGYDDWSSRTRISPAMLSFFSMLPPMENDSTGSTITGGSGANSVELLRRGAREFDVTAAVSAGNLVIVGEVDEAPVPIPLKVNGRDVEGAGTVLAQYIVPIDRTGEKLTDRDRYLEDLEADREADPTTAAE